MPCTRIADDLAALVDGDDATMARHADHLASCDDCRDARYDATRLARAVVHAGSDHISPPDLADRLLAMIPVAAPAPAPAPLTAPAHAPSLAPTPAPTPITAARPRAVRSRRLFMITGVAISGAAAAAAIGIVAVRHHRAASTQPVTTASAGKVVRIEHAAADNEVGLMVRTVGSPAWHALRPGEAIPIAAQLKTDERTRAWIDLADGSRLAVDHRTSLTLNPAPRGFALTDGRVVADIFHDESSPAAVSTPAARIDVLGTRFVVTATAELTAVRVTRGAVRLAGVTGAPTEVRAGEEGTATPSAAASVTAAPIAVADVAWAELATDVDKAAATDGAGSGLGALRAFRPGESRDKDWALTLADHDVKVRIVGPVARTEISETFRNDGDKVLEGVYQFPLPADARIDSLSLDDQKGGFQDGAFIDRERAGKIWRGVIDKATPKIERTHDSDLIWVQGPWRDPALLDWKRGGRFELRVFPIPAKGSRTIKLAYTQVVTPRGDARQYVYPLPHSADGSTAAEKFKVDLAVRGAASGHVHASGYDLSPAPSTDPGVTSMVLDKTAFVPQGDLVIDYTPDGGTAEIRAWTFAGAAAVAPATVDKKGVGLDKDVVAAQQAIAADVRPTAVIALHPALPRWRESRPRDYVFVVDTSQSMVGERAARASALITSAVAELDRRDRFTVLACDSECRNLGDLRAPTGTASTDVATWLAAQEPAGASDLVAAVRAGADRARTSAADREPWVIYVGDGVATTGFRRASDVESAIAATTDPSGVRVTAMAIGGDADTALLAAVARGGGGSFVAYVPGQRVATAAMAVIETTHGAALRDPTVELPAGLVDAAPTVLPTIRAGEEVLIGARVTGEIKGDVILRGTVGGQAYEQHYPLAAAVSTAAGNAFVPRLWASLAIDQLERDGRGEDRAKIVAMSQGYGVMSRHTSLLVLESQAMFDAFGVDRSHPQVAWTGEDSIDEVSADGTVDFAPPAPASGDSGGGGYADAKDSKNADDDTAAVATESTTSPAPVAGAIPAGADFSGGTGTAMAKPALAHTAPVVVAPPRGDTARSATKAADKEPAMNKKADEMPPLDRFGRPMVAMRRTWHRIAAVGTFDGVSTGLRSSISRAEDALAANPDSRERHRSLVQALAYAGEIDQAIGIAKRWLERDRLDPQALGYLADLVGRKGDRDDALRLTAGMVDLDPDSTALHERMIAAYDRGGRVAQACAHRVALASLRATADKGREAGAAVRCLRGLGRDADAALVLRGLPRVELRLAAEKAATVSPIEKRISGDLVVSAAWTTSADLDVSIVTPQGTRLSWLGGRTDLVVTDALARADEKLAVKTLKRGNYLIEIGRTDSSATPGTTPIRGTLEVTAMGVHRTLPFELTGDRAVVGRVGVTLEARLEAVTKTVTAPRFRGRRGAIE